MRDRPLPGPDLDTVELFSEEVLLAVPLRHHLAGRRTVAAAELADEGFVVTRAGQWQRSLLDQLFAGIGRAPIIACEGDEPAAVRGLIAAGVGIGLLPGISREITDSPPVAWLRLEGVTARRILRLYWRRERYLTGAARRFRDLAIDVLSPVPQIRHE